MRAQALISAVLLVTPALAQSPEGRAYFDLKKCVETAAIRYAALEGGLDDAVAATLAACRNEDDAFSRAIDGSPQAAVKYDFLANVRRELRQAATESIANARLGD